jgi:heavy metal sensor kinase
VNPRSIRFRLVIWYGVLALVACLAFDVYTYMVVRRRLETAQLTTLYKRAERIGETLLRPMGATGEPFVAAEIEARFSPEADDRFIRVVRPDGTILYVSGPPMNESFDPRTVPLPPKIPGAMTKPTYGVAPLPNKASLLVLAVPYRAAGGVYLIEAGSSTAYSDQVLRGLVEMLAWGFPVFIAIAAGGGYLLIGKALDPVRRITAAAQQITLRNLSQRLPVVESKDELQRLSVTLNEMIARLEESFQHASRFSIDASHELRTPLTIVRGELEAAFRDPGLSDEMRENLGSVLEELQRLTRIVEGLFTISNLEAGEATLDVHRFDLAHLAATTSDQMALLAEEKQITLACDADTAVPVEGDRARIKQVAVNLLDNAIKYTPHGGKVAVAVRREGTLAVLEVADTGPGIQAEALPRVFDRFYRARDARANGIIGAGLGLAIARSICIAHGGDIEATNRPGPNGGALFRVRLPFASDAGN